MIYHFCLPQIKRMALRYSRNAECDAKQARYIQQIPWVFYAHRRTARHPQESPKGIPNHNPSLFRRWWNKFLVWLLEPIPFPRDHWYQQNDVPEKKVY
jgi:hypothetical protein